MEFSKTSDSIGKTLKNCDLMDLIVIEEDNNPASQKKLAPKDSNPSKTTSAVFVFVPLNNNCVAAFAWPGLF
jgi:hypothetical protein